MTHTLFDSETTATASATVNPERTRGIHREGLFQVEIADSAVVELQGRLSADAPWETIATYEESSVEAVALMPFVRAVITTQGTVSAWFTE